MTGGLRSDLTYVECSDIMVRYRIKEDILKSPLSYYSYTWKDNDRPDSVAFDYYGSTDYAWLVIFSSQVFDYLHDFPMSQREFLAYLKDRYNTDNPYSLQSVIHHYEDSEGFVIDYDAYTSSGDPGNRSVSVFDEEFEQNESRRQVKLLSRKFLQDINEEFEQNFKDIKQMRKTNLSEFILKP